MFTMLPITILDDPSTFRDICELITTGATLVECAKTFGLSYGSLSCWISADKTRRERYDTAIDLRGEFLSDLVIRQLRDLVSMDISQAYDDAGKLLPLREMPESIRKVIIAIETSESLDGEVQTKRVRFADSTKALELLGKYRKMFTDKIEHTGDVSVSVIDYDPQSRPAVTGSVSTVVSERMQIEKN